MSTQTPLIDRLSEELNYPVLDMSNIDDFLSENKQTVLFFTEDANRFVESNDVAVVLPELMNVFQTIIPAVIARDDEKKLQFRYGFLSWPALVFMRGDKYLDVITGIKDWGEYIDQIKTILSSETSRPKAIGIPVVKG